MVIYGFLFVTRARDIIFQSIFMPFLFDITGYAIECLSPVWVISMVIWLTFIFVTHCMYREYILDNNQIFYLTQYAHAPGYVKMDNTFSVPRSSDISMVFLSFRHNSLSVLIIITFVKKAYISQNINTLYVHLSLTL